MTENQASQTENSKKDSFKNMLCYIPFGAPILFFVEQDKSPELSKNIKYGCFLLGALIVGNFITNILPFGNIYGILVFIYLAASGYLGYKAYSGEAIDIQAIDDLEKKVKDNIK